MKVESDARFTLAKDSRYEMKGVLAWRSCQLRLVLYTMSKHNKPVERVLRHTEKQKERKKEET